MLLLLVILHGCTSSRHRIWPSHPRVGTAEVGGKIIPKQTPTGTGTAACTATGGYTLDPLETLRQGWIEDIARRWHGEACTWQVRDRVSSRQRAFVCEAGTGNQSESLLIQLQKDYEISVSMSALELIKRPPSLVEISGWRWASFGPSVQKGSLKRLFVPSTEFVVLVHSSSSQQPTERTRSPCGELFEFRGGDGGMQTGKWNPRIH